MRNFKPFGALVLSALALGACASDGGPRGGGEIEPRAIAVQNSTGQTLLSVSVGEVGEVEDDESDAPRVGRLAPLTRGTTGVIRRAENPRPLAARLRVEWVTPDGESHEQIVEISGALSSEAGATGDTLLLELTAERVDVRLVWGDELNPFGADP